MSRNGDSKQDWLLRVDPTGGISECLLQAHPQGHRMDCRPLDANSQRAKAINMSPSAVFGSLFSVTTLNGRTLCAFASGLPLGTQLCFEAVRQPGASLVTISPSTNEIRVLGVSAENVAESCIFDVMAEGISCSEIKLPGTSNLDASRDVLFVEHGGGQPGILLRTDDGLALCRVVDDRVSCVGTGRKSGTLVGAKVAVLPAQLLGTSDRIVMHDAKKDRVLTHAVPMTNVSGSIAKALSCVVNGWSNRDAEVARVSSTRVETSGACDEDPWGLPGGGPSSSWFVPQFWFNHHRSSQFNLSNLSASEIRMLLCDAECNRRVDGARPACVAAAVLMCGAVGFLGAGVGGVALCGSAFSWTLTACNIGIDLGRPLCYSDCLSRGGG
jgi:hypothetical protein